MKTCTKCKQAKSLSEFYLYPKNKKDGHAWECKDCWKADRRANYAKNRKRILARNLDWAREHPGAMKEYRRRWTVKNWEWVKQRARDETASLRKEMRKAYGEKCSCCGETESRFLTLEHLLHDGANHRRAFPGQSIYRDLKRRGWPKDKYTLMCWNCNMARRDGEPCPHTTRHIKQLLEATFQ